MVKIAIGSDHRGFEHKNYIITTLTDITWVDMGCFNAGRCDYPVFANLVVQAMREGKAQFGVLLCGSGGGMAIAANRFAKIYASLVWNDATARRAKQEDNANILSIPADYVSLQESTAMIMAWSNAEFLGGRYQVRIKQIDTLSGL